MKTIFLTSEIGASKKVDGVRHSCPLNNSNGLVDQLKASIKNFDNFVYVASNPAGDNVDMYANLTFEGFQKAGIGFKNLTVVDNRNKQNVEEIIKNADFVFLSGGLTLTQNQFFKEINLKKYLQNYNGVILGQSAGAMNLAKTVYHYPNNFDQLNDPKFFDGLGLTDMTIVPHFDLVKGNILADEKLDLMNNFLIKDSKTVPLYCITNYSHIKIENNQTSFYGDVYLMKDGEVEQLKNNPTRQL